MTSIGEHVYTLDTGRAVLGPEQPQSGRLAELTLAIHAVANELDALETRLAPVLRPAEPSSDVEHVPEVSSDLHHLVRTLDYQAGRIVRLLARVDL